MCLTPDWSRYCGRSVLLRITVRSRARLIGIYGERCSTGTGFSSVPLPSPVIIPPMLRAVLNLNPLTPNDPYGGRTAPLTSKRCILYIYLSNTGTEYLKHFSVFSLQNAVCFINLTYLVRVLFTFYIQGVLKLKKNNSGSQRLILLFSEGQSVES